jgi:hypothetical protein
VKLSQEPGEMFKRWKVENREQYDENQTILIETVQTVRDFLNNELAKYETWDIFRSDKFSRPNFPKVETEPAFRTIKAKGVGREVLLDFLGKGWKAWKIAEANTGTVNGSAHTFTHVKEYVHQDGVKYPPSASLDWKKPVTLTKGTGWLRSADYSPETGWLTIAVGFNPYA